MSLAPAVAEAPAPVAVVAGVLVPPLVPGLAAIVVVPAPLASDVAIVRPSDPNIAMCGLTKYDAPPESSRRSREKPVNPSLAHARFNDNDIASLGLS